MSGFGASREAKRSFEKVTFTTDFGTNGAETFRQRFTVADWDLLSVQGRWLATHDGTLELYSSEMEDPDDSSDDDWDLVTEIPITGPNASSTGERIPISALGHRWLMWKYANTAGDGAVDLHMTKKTSGV